MKKIYLQPIMNVGAMMPLGLIAASKGRVENEDYSGGNKGGYGVSTDLTGGSGNFGAKDRGFYDSYDNEW